MTQTALTLPHTPSFARADFVVTACNHHAFQQVDSWPAWPSYGLILVGSPASGKTHLAHVWKQKSQALAVQPDMKMETTVTHHLLIDDADRWKGREAEMALFHLLNQAKEQGTTILLTGSRPPSVWEITLPDLRSRLNSLPQVDLPPPDDQLLKAVLAKHFSDRQVAVDPSVVEYVAARIERSFSSLKEVAEKLDQLALREKRAITIPLAKTLFGQDESGD